MAHWPAQLRQMVLLVVQDPSPAVVVYWGDDATIVYNEAYTQLIGRKHPDLQGQDPKIGFAEVWDHFEKLLARQRETAETVVEANAFLLFFRHGFFEETYFSWKFVPIIGEEGWVVGSHATVVEATREVLSDRRLKIVRSLSRQLSGSKSIKDLWHRIVLGIEDADKDIPLALLYSVADQKLASQRSKSLDVKETNGPASTICILEGLVGIPAGHKLASESLDLDNDNTCLVSSIREAMKEMTPVLVQIEDSWKEMFEGIEWRGHGVPATQVVVCPIIPTDDNNILAFLIIALNPRRPYDDDYRGFVHLLTQQVTMPELSAVILREEVQRRQQISREEALDRDRLYRELTESETKFAKFATRAPIGLGILTPQGLALSANDLWRELTQLDIGTSSVNWPHVLCEGEPDRVNKAWEQTISEKQSVTIQTRINRRWQAPDLDLDGKVQYSETHLLLAMYPDLDESGEVTTVMSCITDISGLKWSELQLRKKMDQAIEMKKQQERFIDMTSHEMRNPLSALIGCADEIITSLNELRTATKLGVITNGTGSHSEHNPEISKSLHLLDEAIEAADTIIYCAMHQKRIIDDILTLSRLDSNLLMVSPEPSQPIHLVRSALKMFEAELRRADTKLEVVEEASLETLNVEWTLLDPSRVLQVLINLMTNAIKFTRTEPYRRIKITMGASLDKPSMANHFGVQYVHKNSTSPDQTNKPEWGDGEIIFFCITVTDTGRGLDEGEIKNLFHLFAQASPKTHKTYGGSGLGLFISRQLVEMQGGEIGVASQAGKGSIFQFYVKTRRTNRPKEIQEKTDLQLLVREDALREACAVEISALQNGMKMPNIQLESVRPLSPALHPPKMLHILVVEDNLVNQKVVSKQLRKSGHVVSVANHGEEALEFIKSSEFWEGAESLSVVLMDLEMPVMDGITCVKRIRELQRIGLIRGHVPVIAVTANARKDQIMMSMNAGMDDVTTKPYRMQDMLKQIEKLVARYTRLGIPGG
ncbi:hypothetical protein N431DRAFT_354787 [Stipitochalara longipes BDJ]|nr:hypothetical protein N431DRAFT_354787 [Stipitochalara longipes BDJ]